MKTEIMPEAGRQDREDRLVFVYGTLRRGGCNDINRSMPAPVFLGTTRIAGWLFDLGPYPGLLLAHAGEQAPVDVLGEVYAVSPTVEQQLDVLEEIHGQPDDEYVRRHVSVNVGGQSCICLVYEINPQRVLGRPLINHGDWIRHVDVLSA